EEKRPRAKAEEAAGGNDRRTGGGPAKAGSRRVGPGDRAFAGSFCCCTQDQEPHRRRTERSSASDRRMAEDVGRRVQQPGKRKRRLRGRGAGEEGVQSGSNGKTEAGANE